MRSFHITGSIALRILAVAAALLARDHGVLADRAVGEAV